MIGSVVMEELIREIGRQKEEWDDKLRIVPGSKRIGGANHFCRVEILEGCPSEDVVINFADGWRVNFGGSVSGVIAEGSVVDVVVYVD